MPQIIECPVRGCGVCDTDVNSCDICSLSEAEFDNQSMQCVITDKKGSGSNRENLIIIGKVILLKLCIS